jgi:hypothetical protein
MVPVFTMCLINIKFILNVKLSNRNASHSTMLNTRRATRCPPGARLSWFHKAARPVLKLGKERSVYNDLTDLQRGLTMCDSARNFGARNGLKLKICPRN